jgi:dienelactone hydrolase
MRRLGALALLLTLALPGAGASAQSSDTDQQNRAKSGERAAEHQTPEYQAELRRREQENAQSLATTLAADPERNFATVCAVGGMACAGDVRLYDFEQRGRGIVRPVLWTARNGSTVSGHVWATKAGPAKRPAVVITNGSIQAPEALYWWAAQTLAKHGYVVVTFDPQQQGRSDTFGEGADANEGVPSQTEGNGFYDWTQDAIDFLLSTPAQPFCPRPSRSGTPHCAKQQRRVAAGKNAAFNPYWEMVDGSRIGLAGHSYGAAGVSWVGQQDPRVDAVVAWDNLCDPSVPTSSIAERDAGGGACLRGGTGDPPGHRVPSLGLTADTFTGMESRSEDPPPTQQSAGSRAFSRSGVDTGSIAIRGGTHFEFSYLPSTAFRATLRGMDLSAWYTTAWMDKYVKGDPTADARLLSTRWRHDIGDREVDPQGAGNLFSFTFRSRLDIRRTDGSRFTCEDLRAGCAGMTADDGWPERYSYLAIATAADGTPLPIAGRRTVPVRSSRAARSCTSRRTIRVTVKRRRGLRVRRVIATVGRKRVGAARGRRVVVRLGGLPRGTVRVTLRVTGRRAGRTVRVVQRRTFRTCAKRR